MDRKLTTVIVNETDYDLLMKVGNRYAFVPLAEVKRGGHHALRLCADWAFQEFSMEAPKLGSDPELKVFVNSDECCDFERMTVKESDGQLIVERVARREVEADDKTSKWRVCPWTFRHWFGAGSILVVH